ncbi:MAG: phosphotransferase family protein [Sphingobium sp.]
MKLIETLRRSLREDLAPHLKDKDAAPILETIDLMIVELLDRATTRPAILENSVIALSALTDRARDITGIIDPLSSIMPDEPTPDYPADALLGHSARRIDRLRAELVAAMPAMLALAQRPGEQQQAALDWMRDVVAQQYAETAAETQRRPFESGPDRSTAMPDCLIQSLDRQLEAGGRLEIATFAELSGGYSRRTYSAEVKRLPEASHERLVLRQQRSDGIIQGLGLDVVDEFPLLSLAFAHDLPVPEPLGIENDPNILGGAFLTMRYVQGETLGSHVSAAGVDEHSLRRIAALVASVHRLPWGEMVSGNGLFGLTASERRSSRACLSAYLDRYEILWKAGELRPSPTLSLGFEWLRRNMPDHDSTPILQHGDFGFHNILFRNGEIVALLDWEAAFLGEPAKDLAQCRAFVSGYVEWDVFYRWYLDAGGFEISHNVMNYYNVLRSITQLLIGDLGLETRFGHVDRPDPRYFFLGGPVRRYCFDTLMSDAWPMWTSGWHQADEGRFMANPVPVR